MDTSNDTECHGFGALNCSRNSLTKVTALIMC